MLNPCPTMTFEYLGGSDKADRGVLINSFRVSLAGKRIFAPFTVREDQWITRIGEMALRRAILHAPKPGSPTHVVLGDPGTAFIRVLRAFDAAPEGSVVMLICATPRVYDCALLPFYSRSGVIFALPNGRIVVSSADQAAAVLAEWDAPPPRMT